MQRFRLADITPVSDTSRIFIGDVTKQEMVSDLNANQLRVNNVQFHDGARNKWHSHEVDQVLVVVSGSGIIATEQEELHVASGEVILIPAGERHWHGAEPNQEFEHLAILTPGKVTIYD